MSSEKEQLKDFESLVIKLKNEYAEKNGAVTCEFSTSEEMLVEKLGILNKHSLHNNELSAFWIMFPCNTCKGYHEDRPIHVLLQDGISFQNQADLSNIKVLHSKIEQQNHELEVIKTHCENHISMTPESVAELVELALKGHYSSPNCGKVPDSIIEASYLSDTK